MNDRPLTKIYDGDFQKLLAILLNDGYALTRTDSGDVEQVLIEIGSGWGKLDPHSADPNSVIWHIQPQPNGKARSHSAEPFDFHTDSSFENPPPRIIGMGVINPDRFGAGLSLLLPVRKILKLLDAADKAVLREPIFEFALPGEFNKGQKIEPFPIVFGESFLRFRSDTVKVTADRSDALVAFENLKQAIATCDGEISLSLRKGELLFVDNWTFLHGRTEIKDSERHLLRVRLSLNS